MANEERSERRGHEDPNVVLRAQAPLGSEHRADVIEPLALSEQALIDSEVAKTVVRLAGRRYRSGACRVPHELHRWAGNAAPRQR